ncbi:MAG: TonB-dependent receptor, partial [Planctomycetes bacterium]|nr:TonB-dependent receptor [Planctomycetota bacterium]
MTRRCTALIALGAFVLGSPLSVVGEEPATAPVPVESSDDDPRVPTDVDLGTDVITPSRTATALFELPYSADVVESRLQERQYRTVPEALRDVPGVSVQKTGHGQGSPFIRGFTGYQTLFLIDGIRLNNSVFRSGPNQYWATIDPFSLQRLEVIKGPASVQYGSDAVGGAVNALTRSPRLSGEDRSFHGRLFGRAASAENSAIGRAEVDATVRRGKLGVLGGVTGKVFGDLEGGDHVGTQENTAYDEYAGDVKAEYRMEDGHRLVFLYQKLRINDAPRTHRTQESIMWHSLTQGSDIQRDFDQERDLAYVQLHSAELEDVVDRFSVSVSWQRQQETENRVRSNGAISADGFDVNTYGVWAQAESDSSIGQFLYGVEWYHDEVDSFSSSNAIQGPVGDDATYDLLGVFIQDTIPVGDRVDVILGGRLTWAFVDIGSLEDFGTGNAVDFDDDYFAATGSARAQLFLDEERRFSIFGGASQAFRAPNLSDLTRLDDFGTSGFEIPSTDLDPEQFTQLEIGVKSDHRWIRGQAAYFYTFIDDLILRVPQGPNPSDPTQTIFAKQNSGSGYIHGVELGASVPEQR